MVSDELLSKFYATPGLCSIFELSEVKKYLTKYKEYHDKYMRVRNHEPLGYTLEVDLKSCNWYIDNKR